MTHASLALAVALICGSFQGDAGDPSAKPEISPETRRRVGEVLKAIVAELPIEEEPGPRIRQLNDLARIAGFAGDRAGAAKQLAEAEALKKRIDEPGAIMQICVSLSRTAGELGDFPRALALAEEADRAAEKVEFGLRIGRSSELLRFVDALIDAKEVDRARGELRGLADFFETPIGNGQSLDLVLIGPELESIAVRYRRIGDIDEAEKIVNRIVDKIVEKRPNQSLTLDLAATTIVPLLAAHGWLGPLIRIFEDEEHRKRKFSILHTALSGCERAPKGSADKLLDWIESRFDGWKKESLAQAKPSDDISFTSKAMVTLIARLHRPDLAVRWVEGFKGFRLVIIDLDCWGECALEYQAKGDAEKARKVLADGYAAKSGLLFVAEEEHLKHGFWLAKLGLADEAKKALEADDKDDAPIAAPQNREEIDADQFRQISFRVEKSKAFAALAQACRRADRDQDARRALARSRSTLDTIPVKSDFSAYKRAEAIEELMLAYAALGQATKAIELNAKQSKTDDFAAELLGILPTLVEKRDTEGIKDVLESLDREHPFLVFRAFRAYKRRPYFEMLDWIDHVRNPRDRLELLSAIVAGTLDPEEDFSSLGPELAPS